ASVAPGVDQGRAYQRLEGIAGCNRNRGADRAGGGGIGDRRGDEYCRPNSISPQHDRSEGKTGRGPNGRGIGMNQGQGETALGEDEIGQPDSDQAGNIAQSSAERCPRGHRMSIRYRRSHRLYAVAFDNKKTCRTPARVSTRSHAQSYRSLRAEQTAPG